jgi:bifunctional non-homologous end joining protein LigD
MPPSRSTPGPPGSRTCTRPPALVDIARKGLARLDYTQNAINKTLVAPYSVRAAAGAPVSMPISWDELDDRALRSDRWTVRNTMQRVTETGDRMASMLASGQRLPALS